MDYVTLIVFGLVYLAMFAGGWPGLALDRTGAALLGAIALMAAGRVDMAAAKEAVDFSTLALLFGLMIVSAQFRLSGFYSRVTRSAAGLGERPATLLALVMGAAGLLSAVLANDIVCLAMTPVLVETCARRDLDPKPFLIGLACAANIGSAATLIGNPQNMLIGQALGLSFGGYSRLAGPPSALGLAAAWGVIAWLTRGKWAGRTAVPDLAPPRFSRWQTAKGGAVLLALAALFLEGSLPRDVLALAAAGILLTSRRMASRTMLALADWSLLMLFAGLFVVNRGLADSGLTGQGLAWLEARGLDLAGTGTMFGAAGALSNLVSNVPAAMLLLPATRGAESGTALALASTLAGNLCVAGSIANIIVLEQAANLGLRVSWKEHARMGAPVTLVTMALAWAWLVAAGG